jgi:NADP-dependent 3-hydroxy acid dehydrogenase YdfG
MGKLEGKIAVVTGGNSGIGLASAQRLVGEGAYVFITGRRQGELDAAVKQLGKSVTAAQGDVSSLADLDRLYATVKKQKGHIDILFANAGTGEFAPLGAISEEHFDKIFNANVKGLLFTVQKALPLLKDGSSIILNASIVSATGPAAFSVYSASKAAVRSFARTFTTDLKDRKIHRHRTFRRRRHDPNLTSLTAGGSQCRVSKAFVGDTCRSFSAYYPRNLMKIGRSQEICGSERRTLLVYALRSPCFLRSKVALLH